MPLRPRAALEISTPGLTHAGPTNPQRAIGALYSVRACVAVTELQKNEIPNGNWSVGNDTVVVHMQGVSTRGAVGNWGIGTADCP